MVVEGLRYYFWCYNYDLFLPRMMRRLVGACWLAESWLAEGWLAESWLAESWLAESWLAEGWLAEGS